MGCFGRDGGGEEEVGVEDGFVRGGRGQCWGSEVG